MKSLYIEVSHPNKHYGNNSQIEKDYDKIQLYHQFELENKSKPIPINLKEKLLYYFPRLLSLQKNLK